VLPKPFAAAYNADLVDLEHELHQTKRLVERMGDTATEKPTSLLTFVSMKHFMSCIALLGLQ